MTWLSKKNIKKYYEIGKHNITCWQSCVSSHDTLLLSNQIQRKRTSSVVPPYFLRQSLSVNHELSGLTGCPTVYLSPTPRCLLLNTAFPCAGELNSGPHACTQQASTLLAEPSLQHPKGRGFLMRCGITWLLKCLHWKWQWCPRCRFRDAVTRL